MLKKMFFLLIAGLSFTSLQAQITYLKNLEEVKAFSKKSATLFKEGKVSETFDELQKYWPMPANEITSLETNSIKQLNIARDRFGEPEKVVKIREETIQDFGLRETYLVKYKFYAIRLVFTYYKNNEGWIMVAFSWDDKFAEEFK